jgi:hypothetical protein
MENQMKKSTFLAIYFLTSAVFSMDVALDLSSATVRSAQPKFSAVSYEVGVIESLTPTGDWAFRFKVTKPWSEELPQWPSVNLSPTISDWSKYDRLVVDVYNDSTSGDTLSMFISEPQGRIQHGLSPRSLVLSDFGHHRWVIPLANHWPSTCKSNNIGRVHLFMTTPYSADIYVSGFYLLKPGDAAPEVSDIFLKKKIEPAKTRAEAARAKLRHSSISKFIASCRAAKQKGDFCWVGKATSMDKIMPRSKFYAVGANSFSLKLARGEYESLQVLVMPSEGDLEDVSVKVSELRRERSAITDWLLPCDRISSSAFKSSPVGYVHTVNPAPYRSGSNVTTNLPGGYYRKTIPSIRGWHPDAILDYLDRASIKGDDLQSFWVRLKCPIDQRAGIYRGVLYVSGRGWRKEFPFAVRVYDFSVPEKSPLPLAITFNPDPSLQYADDEQLKLAAKLRKDPLSPINQWKKHKSLWGDFLADYYITMSDLYHHGNNIRWDILKKLQSEGRLGFFNLGYWDFPRSLDSKSKEKWIEIAKKRFKSNYEKAKELGLISHAYLYGCDEVHSNHFNSIKWAIDQLKREFPGVPIFTTAYDRRFGMGTALSQMDWFTPTTDMYEKDFEHILASRAAGHQVWWYIACGQQSPRANLFIEAQPIEARQLMGAQTVKYRPDGFLYYQVSIWNSHRCISGTDTFTDWEPRSWTTFHGDGSWFCCGPDGTPLATLRIENFRDGLEDYAYALEYERRTGKKCEVPPEVCHSVWQFSDDPAAIYAWRDRIAEAIERE